MLFCVVPGVHTVTCLRQGLLVVVILLQAIGKRIVGSGFVQGRPYFLSLVGEGYKLSRSLVSVVLYGKVSKRGEDKLRGHGDGHGHGHGQGQEQTQSHCYFKNVGLNPPEVLSYFERTCCTLPRLRTAVTHPIDWHVACYC